MKAFDGLRVLDLTHVLAGPFATYQLAVLGADVIKIEPVDEPDMNREVGPFAVLNDARMGSHYLAQSGNKRAMSLNLKCDEGQEIFKALARNADVIVENYRAGALEKLGVGYEDIREFNPRIIYCSMTGFGQTGPKRDHTAYDNVIQAFSGLMMSTGKPDGEAFLVGPPVLDYGTGAQAAFAISAALLRRERTGLGQRIDVAMLDAALMLMTTNVLNTSATGEAPHRIGNGGNHFAAYGCYDAADGQIMLGIVTARQNSRMWRVLGRDDLSEEIKDSRLPDIVARRHRDAAILSEIIKTRTADEWERIFNAAGVPAARVRTLDEALAREQTASRGVLGEQVRTGSGEVTYRTTVAAFGCSEDGPALTSPPPEFGQHTAEIIESIGYSPREIHDLKRRGVI